MLPATDVLKKLQTGLISSLPGLIFVTIIAISSLILAEHVPMLGAVSIAIIIGMTIGNLQKFNWNFNPGISFSEKRILPVAIALLGTSLELDVLVALGFPALSLIVSMVAITILTARFLGKRFGFSPSFSLLMGTGNAICGSSAIAAVSHTLKASEEEIGLSVGVVNFMGVLGLFILPIALYPLNLTSADNGLVIGGSLQAVGQVVAAGYSMGQEVGAAAVVVKMGRVLLLGPVAVVFAFLAGRKDRNKSKINFKFPVFILGFFLLSFLASYNFLPPQIVATLKTSGKFLLVLSMSAIGFKIQFKTLKQQGSKVMLFGLALALLQLTYIAVWLMIF